MINVIDKFMDRITMYRFLTYYLITILAAALFFGAIGVMSYNPLSITISLALAVTTCLVLNYFFSKIFNAPANWESALITGLILSLIISPALTLQTVPLIIAASGLAIASKYILSIHNKHIFNPAAVAVVLTALGPQEPASWWVGSVWLLPFVIIGGLLISRKIRHMSMTLMFIGVAVLSTVLWAVIAGNPVMPTFTTVLLHSSLFFLGFVMLTEPATSPTTRNRRYLYAIVVGILFAPAFHVGSVYSTPELALIIGNLLAFIITPIVRTKVKVAASVMFGQRTQDISFIPERSFVYKPGQYIEMTLPHSKRDARGLRRYFTLASSPTEAELHLGVRYSNPGSSFKQALRSPSKYAMSFGQLGGDFVMPADTTKKLAFIAGGIGVTPFRSMLKYMSDNNEQRNVALIYVERSEQDIAYYDVLEEARIKVGVRTIYILDTPSIIQNSMPGPITTDVIAAAIPDYLERIFYISGPQPMVHALKSAIESMGIPRNNIMVDYFPGYA